MAKDWIKKAIKHPGRCTKGSPNYDCPKGSPQFNLAKTLRSLHADGGELFGVDGYQDHGFGITQPDYACGGNMYFLGGVKPPTTLQGSAGNVAGSIGGMIPTDTRGGAAASGAMKGAELGMNFGPYGAIAGTILGGAAGFIGQDAKMKRDEFEASANDMKQRNELLGIKAMGGGLTRAQNDSIIQANKNIPSIRRILNPNPKDVYKWPNGISSTHMYGSYGNMVIPSIQMESSNRPGANYLEYFSKPVDRAYEVGDTIRMKNPEQAEDFAKNYKNSDAWDNYIKKMNIKANGGYVLPQGVSANMATQYAGGGFLNEFNNGGSHESNPQHGVPQGISGNGQPNLVEQGETKYQDYIFSYRLKLDEKAVNDHNLPKSMINKTFADASKRIAKLHKERPNDPITRDTMKSKMDHLMQANDEIREYEQSSMMASGGHLYDGLSQKTGRLQLGSKYYDDNGSEFLSGRVGDEFFSPGLKQPLATGKFESNKLMAKANSITKNNKPDLGFLKDPKNLRYTPIAFDALAATGLFGKSPKPETYSPSLIKQQGNLIAPQINEEAMRAKIDAAYQNQIKGLAGASGGSGAALRSGLTGLGSDYMSAVGQGFLGAETANNQAKMQADQYNLGTTGNVASQNAQMINQAEMYNNQLLNQNNALNYDTRMSYLGKGAEGLGDIGYEQRNAEILPRLFGYNQYGQYKPLNAKACGGRLKLMRRKK